MTIECSNLKISISEVVLNIFTQHIQSNSSAPESGGVLTGKIYERSIEIINCSEPSDKDIRSRFNFNRSFKTAQNFINEKFKKSKGEEIYLGEWHTHPEAIPSPSCTDIKSLKKTITKNQLNSNIHFMIIVGTVGIYFGIYINKKFYQKIIMPVE